MKGKGDDRVEEKQRDDGRVAARKGRRGNKELGETSTLLSKGIGWTK